MRSKRKKPGGKIAYYSVIACSSPCWNFIRVVVMSIRVDLSQWFVIKVILEKSRDEVSLMEQDSIENVSKPIKFFEKNIFFNFFREKKCLYNFILCNFLVWTLQFFHFVFYFFCLTTKTWKNRPKKLLMIGPIFFFSNANQPKSSPNLKSCSIKISNRGTSL